MDQSDRLKEYTISSALRALQDGTLTAGELARAALAEASRRDAQLHAFITLTPELALAQAEAADQALSRRSARRRRPRLLGIPIAIKDLIDIQGIRTTSGSRFFTDQIAGEDAEVIRRLKQAGAVLVGKTNTHEIALGVTGVNPHYGTVGNPWDAARISGGSSSGSAAAVASGMCLAALGTDTGGSVRIPASLCGVVGLKPTIGRISLCGVMPLSWNLDHVGILARTVQDAGCLLDVLSGYDSHDPASQDQDEISRRKRVPGTPRKWRVAWGVGEYVEDCDVEVWAGVRQAAEALGSIGACVERVDCSWLSELAEANGRMTQSDAACIHHERLVQQPDWFGADVRARLEAGASLSSSEYILARRTQVEGRRRMDQLFGAFDLLLLPTTPIPAPLIQEVAAIAAARQLTRFTSPFNLCGIPALSVPYGRTTAGLPFGIQLIAPAWHEARLIRAGLALQE